MLHKGRKVSLICTGLNGLRKRPRSHLVYTGTGEKVDAPCFRPDKKSKSAMDCAREWLRDNC